MLRCNICLHVLRNCCAISAPSYLFCFIAQKLYFFGVSVLHIFCPWEIVAHCPCVVYLCILCA